MTSRGDVIHEIISSEEQYVFDLQSLTDWYIIPIRDHPTKILDSNDIQQQFGYLEAIYGLHKNLYDSMQLAIKNAHNNYDDINMGPIFKKFSHFSRMYKTYLSTYEDALIKRGYLLTKNTKLIQLLEVIGADPRCNNLKSLEGLLEEPISRISRYRVLLEQLLSLTAPIHYDYDSIIDSLKIIIELDNADPEKLTKRMNYEKILSIILEFDSKCRINLLENTSRVYVRDASMIKQCRLTKKEFRFWLFNDILVYGEIMPNGRYWLSHQIPLMNTRITPAVNVEKENFAFQISAPEKCFVVWGRSEQEKCDWLADLSYHSTYSRAKLKAETGHEAPVWVPDNANAACALCTTEFTFIKRRHHCRHCGSVICGDCSRHRFLLPHIDKKPSRICDICHTKLATTNLEERKEQGQQFLNMAKSLFKPPAAPSVGPPPAPVLAPPAPVLAPPAPVLAPPAPVLAAPPAPSIAPPVLAPPVLAAPPPPSMAAPQSPYNENKTESNNIVNDDSPIVPEATNPLRQQPQVNKFLRRATSLHKTQLVGGAGIKDSFSPSRDSAVRGDSYGREEGTMVSTMSDLSFDMEFIYGDRESTFHMPSNYLPPTDSIPSIPEEDEDVSSLRVSNNHEDFQPASIPPPPPPPPPPPISNPFGGDDDE